MELESAVHFLARAAREGGRVVSSNDLNKYQIAEAQTKGNWWVSNDGLGWAILPWDLTTDKDRDRERAYFVSQMGKSTEKNNREQAEFNFRAWVHPEDGDAATVEVWYQGLEPTDLKKVSVADWAQESFYNEDFHALFDLDKTKHWQVVGTGKIRGWYDYFGEYDEELTVDDYEKEEVPAEWFNDMLSLEPPGV